MTRISKKWLLILLIYYAFAAVGYTVAAIALPAYLNINLYSLQPAAFILLFAVVAPIIRFKGISSRTDGALHRTSYDKRLGFVTEGEHDRTPMSEDILFARLMLFLIPAECAFVLFFANWAKTLSTVIVVLLPFLPVLIYSFVSLHREEKKSIAQRKAERAEQEELESMGKWKS